MSMDRYRRQLSECITGLEIHQEILHSLIGDALEQFRILLGATFSQIELSDRPVNVAGGIYSTGKSSFFSRHMSEPLPSGDRPTSRVFAVIEPRSDATEVSYSVVHLGRAEARRFLHLLADNLQGTVQRGLRRLLQSGASPKTVAERTEELIAKEVKSYSKAEDRRKLSAAAFLCRSIARNLSDRDSRWEERLLPNGFTPKQQAEHYLSWGMEDKIAPLIYSPGTPADGPELIAELDDWFDRKSRLESFRDDPDYHQIRVRYEVTLRLGAISYVRITIPPSAFFLAGQVWADTPGTAASLHDAIKTKICFDSTSRAVFFDNSLFAPGNVASVNTKDNLDDRKVARAIVFTYGDYRLTHDLADSLSGLSGSAEDATIGFKAIISKFANYMEAGSLETSTRRWLDSEDPADTNRILIVCNVFGMTEKQEQRDATDACRELTAIARFLGDESIQGELPAGLASLVRRHIEGQGLTPVPLPAVDQHSRRLVARLAALLVSLGDDGGLGQQAIAMRDCVTNGEDPRIERLAEIREKLDVLIPRLKTDPEDLSQPVLPPDQERLVTEVNQTARFAQHALRGELGKSFPCRRFLELPERISRGEIEPASMPAAPEEMAAELLKAIGSLGRENRTLDALSKVLASVQRPADSGQKAEGSRRDSLLGRELDSLAVEMRAVDRRRSFRDVGREYFAEIVAQLPRQFGVLVDEVVDEVAANYGELLNKHLAPILPAPDAPGEGDLKSDTARPERPSSGLELMRMAAANSDLPTIATIVGSIKVHLRHAVATSIGRLWHEPFALAPDAGDAMGSLSTDLFEPDSHIYRFLEVSRFVVESRLSFVFVAAANESTRRAEEEIQAHLERIKQAFGHESLTNLLIDGVKQGAEMVQRKRRAEARHALETAIRDGVGAAESLLETLRGEIRTPTNGDARHYLDAISLLSTQNQHISIN